MKLGSTDAVVLLSGGLDSSANLALACDRGWRCVALTINYGQRAWESERRAAHAIAAHYDVPVRELDLAFIGSLGRSALTDASIEIPGIARERLDDRVATEGTANAVWVPNRNGVMISLASAWAEAVQAPRVLIGFNREEAATFPDNSRDFMEAMNRALFYSTRGKVSVESLIVDLTKAQTVGELRRLSNRFPFDLVWSCYRSGATQCGHCESCQRFLRAMAS
ncbi:MAG: 7-cyano-7-deazaguanine synthase QueC [Oligoflexia bacterium]|jgi:7-cyano-7-deazaguanine synthase